VTQLFKDMPDPLVCHGHLLLHSSFLQVIMRIKFLSTTWTSAQGTDQLRFSLDKVHYMRNRRSQSLVSLFMLTAFGAGN